MLGDELRNVNGVKPEGLPFDEIIASVQKVGGDSAPGTPLSMRFRPGIKKKGDDGKSSSRKAILFATRKLPVESLTSEGTQQEIIPLCPWVAHRETQFLPGSYKLLRQFLFLQQILIRDDQRYNHHPSVASILVSFRVAL